MTVIKTIKLNRYRDNRDNRQVSTSLNARRKREILAELNYIRAILCSAVLFPCTVVFSHNVQL